MNVRGMWLRLTAPLFQDHETPVATGPYDEMVTLRRWRLSPIYVVTFLASVEASGFKPVRRKWRLFFRGPWGAFACAQLWHLEYCNYWAMREYNCRTHGPMFTQAVADRMLYIEHNLRRHK